VPRARERVRAFNREISEPPVFLDLLIADVSIYGAIENGLRAA
jgi:hypothetical protein